MGGLAGPLVGIFFLGVFVPFAHERATVCALAIASIINMILTTGSTIIKPFDGYKYVR